MLNGECFMIQIVDRTFDLLEFLARQKESVSNSVIAEEMGISIQSANNLLRTLYRRGYVSQDCKRNYRLGARCIYLGSYADRWGALRARLAAPVKQLVAETGYVAFAGVIENDRMLCIIMQDPSQTEPYIPQQRWYDELHSTASGRVLLAALSKKERGRLYKRICREISSRKNPLSEKALAALCEETEAIGFAEVHDESVQGVSSIAIPLLGEEGHVVAALALSGPDSSWNRLRREEKVGMLRRAAELAAQ